METSITKILKKELIGKEIKIYKYTWGSTIIYYYYKRKVDEDCNYLGYEYVKITNVEFDLDKLEDIVIVLGLERSEFISTNSMYIRHYSTIDLKEKGD